MNTNFFMLKKILSYLIIFSILLPPESWGMKSNAFPISDDGGRGKSHRLSVSKRAVDSPRSGGTFSLKDMSSFIRAGSSLGSEGDYLLGNPTIQSYGRAEETEIDASALGEGGLAWHTSGDDVEGAIFSDGGAYQEESDMVPGNASSSLRSSGSMGVVHPLSAYSPTDIENIPNLPLSVQALLRTVQALDDGDADQQRTARFLVYAYDNIIQSKLTRRQLFVGGFGGLVLASCIGTAIYWLYIESVENMLTLNGVSKTVGSYIFYEDFIDSYAQWVIFTDVACRNVKALTQLTAPSFSEVVENRGFIYKTLSKITTLTLYGASSPAALLLCYSLYKTMFDEENYFEKLPLYSITIYIIPLALSLFIDDVVYFGSRLNPLAKTILRDYFVNRTELKSIQTERSRAKFIEEFKYLRELFLVLSDDSIEDAFEEILCSRISSNKSGERLSTLLKSMESLKTLKGLHRYYTLHSQHVFAHDSKTLLNYLRKIPEWGLPLIATWGRSVIFYYIMDESFLIVGLENEPVRMTLSVILGGMVGSFVQLNFEAQGIRHLLNKFLKEKEEPSSSPSSFKHKIVKTGVTFHNYFAGLWGTIPYMVVGVYATSGWNIGPRIACLAFSGLTAFLGGAMALEESTEDVHTLLQSLDLTSQPDRTSQKRRRLIKLTQQYKDVFANLNSGVIDHIRFLFDRVVSSTNQAQERHAAQNIIMINEKLLASGLRLQLSQDTKDQKTLHFLIFTTESLTQNRVAFSQAIMSGSIGIMFAATAGVSLYGWLIINIQNSMPSKITDPIFYFTYGAEIIYIVPIFVLDALSRTIQFASSCATSSTVEFEIPAGPIRKMLEMTRTIFPYGVAGFASVLQAYYYLKYDLWFEEFEGSDIFYDFGIMVPFIFLNSFFFYGPPLSCFVDRVFNRFSVPYHGVSSPAEEKRAAFLKEFEDLKRWFARLKDDDAHEVYDQVFNGDFHEGGTPEQRDQYLAAGALKTLWVLRQYHTNNHHMMREPEPETYRKTFAKAVGWGLPIFASFGNAVTYWFLFYNLFQIVGLDDETISMALSILFGGVIGSLGQTAVEVEATEKAVYELTGGRKIGHDTGQGFIRRSVRVLGKAQNYFFGGLLALPFIGIGMAGTANWPLWLRLCAFVPAGLAEALKNTLMFNESIGGAAQFVDNKVVAKLAYPTATQKRNQLVSLARRYRKMFKNLHSDILLKLDNMITQVEYDHSSIGNDEN